MDMKEWLRLISDILFPPRRSNCPHCGGVRCIGMCGADLGDERKKSGTRDAATPPSPPEPPEQS